MLAFERVGAKTILRTLTARSPVKLLTPKNHGDAAWVFVASFGGGLVDGDRLHLRVEVGPGASALLGTQASTKVYRSPSACAQRLDARVSRDATLVVVPDPVTCFEGARYTQAAQIVLEPGASLLFVDGLTCGRSARGERWAFARYLSRTRVVRGEALAVHDALLLDPAQGPLGARMGRFDAVLSLMLLGPRFAPLCAQALSPGSAPALERRADVLETVSPLGAGPDGGVLVRIAAVSVERAVRALRAHLAGLPAILGDDPFARKW